MNILVLANIIRWQYLSLRYSNIHKVNAKLTYTLIGICTLFITFLTIFFIFQLIDQNKHYFMPLIVTTSVVFISIPFLILYTTFYSNSLYNKYELKYKEAF